MAKIEVIAFVQNWRYDDDSEPNPSWGMKIDEVHSKGSNETGWEVIGHTYFTVKAGWEVNIDFTQFKKGDRVEVKGRQVTEKKGEYSNLIIKADSVTLLAAGKRSHPAAGNVPQIADAPF
jgi:hypothetical protein